jgi:lipoyl(octanoyl) transferase
MAGRMKCVVTDLGVVPYRRAFEIQKRRVERVQAGTGDEALYLLEHPPVITLGRNATGSAILADADTITRRGVEIVETDRGGDVTFHGPGQLVGYPIIALEDGRKDIRRYVHDLEEVLLRALDDFGISSRRHAVHRGVWVGEKKIASLGIRIARWVTCHGFALNVSTDLDYYRLITPCGISNCEMTSIAAETGSPARMSDVKAAVVSHFADVFKRPVVLDGAGAAAGG